MKSNTEFDVTRATAEEIVAEVNRRVHAEIHAEWKADADWLSRVLVSTSRRTRTQLVAVFAFVVALAVPAIAVPLVLAIPMFYLVILAFVLLRPWGVWQPRYLVGPYGKAKSGSLAKRSQ